MKTTYKFLRGITLLLCCFSMTMVAQQANNNCVNAIPITCGSSTPGSTVGATDSDPIFCGTSNTAGGVWYSVVGDGGSYIASTCNAANYDTKISVYSGSCGSLSCVGGNDDGSGCSGFTSLFAFPTQPGVTYYIYVHGFGSATGNFTLSLNCAAPPPPLTNDECSSPVALTVNSFNAGCVATYTADHTNATDSNATYSCDTFGTNIDTWYTFVAPASGGVIIQTTDITQGGTSEMALFTGCNGTELACEFGSEETFTGLTPNQTYTLAIWYDDFNTEGSFEICVTATPPPPANDMCMNAEQVICGQVATGNTDFASDNDPPACGTSASNAGGVWYLIEGTGGDINIDLSGSDYDTKLFVYDGSCGALNCIDGDDDGGTGFDSALTFSSTAGIAYYIYVTGFGTSTGDYVMSINCICEGTVDDNCNTVFPGFDPAACATLTFTGEFGLPPYTFELSDGQTNGTGTFVVCPSSTTTYIGTVTDAAGCMSSVETTVVAVDVTCGNNAEKVILCHVEGDGSSHEICVSPNAVQAHLNHGDSLGPCGSATCETVPVCDSILKVPGPGATDVDYNGLELIWGAATGFVQGYLLSIGTTPGGTDVLDSEDVGDTLSYTIDLLPLTTYYVTVVPYNDNGTGSGCGESFFTTSQSEWCLAPVIACDSSVSDNTGINGETRDLPFCVTSFGNPPGMWYQFQGNGDDIVINTCNGSDFDTVLKVYTSPDCATLECLGGDDQASECSDGDLSYFEFSSEPGENYYIYVTGWGSGETGNFTLSLECNDPPAPMAGDSCGNAIPLACNTQVAGDTNGFPNMTEPECAGFTESTTVWYRITGTGGDINLATNGPSGDTVINVYNGACSSLSCVGGDDDDGPGLFSDFTFSSNLGTIYYVAVSDWGSSGSVAYTLTTSCLASRDAAVDGEPLSWGLFPNPTNTGEVTLDLANYINQDLGIQMMDFSGKMLINNSETNLQNPRYTLGVQGMANGMYFVRVVTESGVSTKKLIIAN